MASPDDLPDPFSIVVDAALLRYVRSPPPESAVARARAFGIDVDALVIKMAATTPIERLAALDTRIEEIRTLRRGLQ